MNGTEFVRKAAEHVRAQFETHNKPELFYHNLNHTESVVKAATQIADHYQLEEEDYTAVLISAWFHDVGYLFTTQENHEAKGVELATEFINSLGGNTKLIKKVSNCILSTKMPQTPDNLLAKIVCDADLFHLGNDNFYNINLLVRKEYKASHDKNVNKTEWTKWGIGFLQEHTYHTDYCKALLQKGKQANISLLKEKIKSSKDKVKKPDSKENNGIKKRDEKPSRGIETMFRTTSTNHLRLSEMADTKANIMITVNSIIASMLVSMLFRKLEDDPYLIIPAILFLVTALISIIFAILVTRPNVTKGTFTKEDIKEKRANLLFFGNFHKMKLDDYQQGISAMMNDSGFLYGSMTRDIYHLGIVLGRKYRLLRLTYNIFMFGFIISILSFVLAVTIAK